MAVIGDIYSVKVFCRITPVVAAAQVSINVLHYRVSAVAGLEKNDQEIADAFDTFWDNPYKTYLSDQASYRGVLVQKIRPLPIAIAVSATAGAGAGTRVAGELLPPQVSGIITKQTLGAGRAKRGRIYMPFPGEGDSTDAVPNAAYIAALSAFVPLVVSGVTAGVAPNTTSFLPVIYHRATGLTDDINTAVARPYFVTQRRRSFVSGGDVSPIG